LRHVFEFVSGWEKNPTVPWVKLWFGSFQVQLTGWWRHLMQVASWETILDSGADDLKVVYMGTKSCFVRTDTCLRGTDCLFSTE
jgi:hypothetical protein